MASFTVAALLDESPEENKNFGKFFSKFELETVFLVNGLSMV